MAIARKPKTSDNTSSVVDVDALIAKGGTVAKDRLGSDNAVTEGKESGAFTLRIPNHLLRSLDTHIKKRPIKTSRQYWILEAIIEKLEKEGGDVSG